MVNDLNEVFAQGMADGMEKVARRMTPGESSYLGVIRKPASKVQKAVAGLKRKIGPGARKAGKWVMKNKGKAALIGAGAAAAGYGGYRMYKDLKNRKNKK